MFIRLKINYLLTLKIFKNQFKELFNKQQKQKKRTGRKKIKFKLEKGFFFLSVRFVFFFWFLIGEKLMKKFKKKRINKRKRKRKQEKTKKKTGNRVLKILFFQSKFL